MSKNVYTPPDRSTYDPGWNDPPPMSNQPPPAAVATTKPRLNLNKRVAFPVQPSGSPAPSQTVKTTAEGLPLPFSTAKYDPRVFNPVAHSSVPTPANQLPPPPMASTLPPTSAQSPAPNSALPSSTTSLPAAPSSMTPPSVPPASAILRPPVAVDHAATMATDAPASDAFDADKARDYCRKVVERLLAAPRSSTDPQKIADIRKRLDLLQDMWRDGKIDEAVQKVLNELVTALEAGDTDTAMDQHRILGTTYVSQSMQWATALRQLILINSTSHFEPVEAEPGAAENAVQFLDISTSAAVLSAPVFDAPVLDAPAMNVPLLAAPISSAPMPDDLQRDAPVSSAPALAAQIPSAPALDAAVLNAPVLPVESVHVLSPAGPAVQQSDESKEGGNHDSQASSSKHSRFGRILHL